MFYIVGLGNPGAEYENTRHNTGWILLEHLRATFKFPEWEEDKKLNARVSEGKIGKVSVSFILPETFMNNSGRSVAPLVKSKKAAEQLVVIHDDLDIPFGSVKFSFNKSSGGHRGVDSIVKAVKTEAFIRFRIGISPSSSFPKGGARFGEGGGFKLKKPKGEAAVSKHILGKFSSAELATLKKISQKIGDALATLVADGREKAMSQFQGQL